MKKILIIILALFGMISCNDDFLDISPLDRVSDDAVWSDQNLINAYHTALYNGIPHGFSRNMYSKFCDEANGVNKTLQMGTFTPDNISGYSGGNDNYMYYWNRGYQYIRKVNLFIEKMQTTNLTIDGKDKLVAEAKFIRAFMYFELIKRFGGVPIVTKSYELGSDELFARSSFDACVTFIETDLNEALPKLPIKYTSTDTNFGRATQDACKALKSRLYLYAASPLFNTTNDKTKWQKAADAAESLLNSGYTLYSNYGKCFQTLSGEVNNEIIFGRLFTISNSHQMPMVNLGRRWGAYGGWGAGNGPSQNLVDDYEMANGNPAFIYVSGVKTANITGGYDPQNPYKNRGPRFDATIQHDGTVYRGTTLEMWIGSDSKTWGFDSYKQSGDNPRTNYVINKFMPDVNIALNWQTYYTNPWMHFRLAEIYLNYAEAKFELGDEPNCRLYINKVRARAGMPDLAATVTGEELRSRLYNERRIELALEGHRFFDVRRWKIAMVTENTPIFGMDIIKNATTGVKTYTPIQLLVRSFTESMYLLPIEANEISRNPNITQTPGWE